MAASEEGLMPFLHSLKDAATLLIYSCEIRNPNRAFPQGFFALVSVVVKTPYNAWNWAFLYVRHSRRDTPARPMGQGGSAGLRRADTPDLQKTSPISRQLPKERTEKPYLATHGPGPRGVLTPGGSKKSTFSKPITFFRSS